MKATCLALALLLAAFAQLGNVRWASAEAGGVVELPGDVLADKIRGGLLGQMLGNLNGLKHEMKYIGEPGHVEAYVPALPDGAWTDDDTDLEWVYICRMLDENRVLLSPEQITLLWRQRINRRIWCANQYARQLMDLGIQPPQTGMMAFNPWSEFNISGQFVCETFGLIAPCMPQTAARIGLNYTRVTIDGEPAQATQLFTTMIATAFHTRDMRGIIQAGREALDPASVLRQIVEDECRWHQRYPDQWRTTRRLTQEKYSRFGGASRDRNGHELNTAAIIAALLYGEGDFVETLRVAFNFGWDADCNAATAGTVVGVTKGYRWMLSQGWRIVDRYRNTTRDRMPRDETITSFADRLLCLAERVILEGGGARVVRRGRPVYRIVRQRPGNVYPLPDREGQVAGLRASLEASIRRTIGEAEASKTDKARAAYYAICLDLAEAIRRDQPARWRGAVQALQDHENVVEAIFHHADVPLGRALQKKAIAAGLQRPATKKRLWE